MTDFIDEGRLFVPPSVSSPKYVHSEKGLNFDSWIYLRLRCKNFLNQDCGTSFNFDCGTLSNLDFGTFLSLECGTFLKSNCGTFLNLDCAAFLNLDYRTFSILYSGTFFEPWLWNLCWILIKIVFNLNCIPLIQEVCWTLVMKLSFEPWLWN